MGHVKTMQAFGQLKGTCTGLGGSYNPGQQNLQVKALTTIQFNAQQVMDEIIEAKTAYDNITNRRQMAFREAKVLGSRLCSLLKSSGADPLTIQDALASNRKLQGRLRYRAPEPKPAEGDTPADSRRKRAMSYGNQAQYFAELVETVTIDPFYNPTEENLRVEQLAQKVVELRSLNELVLKAEQNLSRLKQKRRALFYEDAHSLVNTARAVRAYIRGVFGFMSEPHAELAKLSLTKLKTR